jgi:predicted acylesterase/phospholipase RssA
MTPISTVIFQSAKLGDIPHILDEFDSAKEMVEKGDSIKRVFGISGGALVACAFALEISALREPGKWGFAKSALSEFQEFLKSAHSMQIRSLNLNPKYGRSNLKPLRRWIATKLKQYSGKDDLKLSELPIPLYLATLRTNSEFTLFGPVDESLQMDYHFIHIGPPEDTTLLDACMAALSTPLSTEPVMINQKWCFDCRPAIVDGGAIVADLLKDDPAAIWRTTPHAAIRPWKVNFITSSFIMHSQHERNQVLLADEYLTQLHIKQSGVVKTGEKPEKPHVYHVQLPYVGSTEAATNMRDSVANRVGLMAKFTRLLDGQLNNIDFKEPANLIYGAGGFSGILGGLTATRAIDEGFKKRGGKIKQIYGVSAGLINGFFHAIEVAARQNPDIYKPDALNALKDLDDLIATMTPDTFLNINLNPFKFWKGWANLGPFERFLIQKLNEYTGNESPEKLTFDDIKLPLTVTAARGDGFTEFMGMTQPERQMEFAGREIKVISSPIVKAMVAGWSMNTYVIPAELNGQLYRDGGGTFYDPGYFVARMDADPINLINIHLDDPEGHYYALPDRMNIFQLILDTHNMTFPEERRRMFHLTNLYFENLQNGRIK